MLDIVMQFAVLCNSCRSSDLPESRKLITTTPKIRTLEEYGARKCANLNPRNTS